MPVAAPMERASAVTTKAVGAQLGRGIVTLTSARRSRPPPREHGDLSRPPSQALCLPSPGWHPASLRRSLAASQQSRSDQREAVCRTASAWPKDEAREPSFGVELGQPQTKPEGSRLVNYVSGNDTQAMYPRSKPSVATQTA